MADRVEAELRRSRAEQPGSTRSAPHGGLLADRGAAHRGGAGLRVRCGLGQHYRVGIQYTTTATRCGNAVYNRHRAPQSRLLRALAGVPLRALAAAIKARWVCEQAHQQLKQELGLGHFEGRSWTGLHRHALMTCLAFAHLQHLRLAEHRRRTAPGKKAAPRSGAAAVAEPARGAPRRHRPAVRAPRRVGPVSALQAQVPAAP